MMARNWCLLSEIVSGGRDDPSPTLTLADGEATNRGTPRGTRFCPLSSLA